MQQQPTSSTRSNNIPQGIDLSLFKTKIEGDTYLSSLGVFATFQHPQPDGSITSTSETLEYMPILQGAGRSPAEFLEKRTIRPDTVIEENRVTRALPTFAAMLREPQGGSIIHGGASSPPAPNDGRSASGESSDSDASIHLFPSATQAQYRTPSPAPSRADTAATPVAQTRAARPQPLSLTLQVRSRFAEKFAEVKQDVKDTQTALVSDINTQAELSPRAQDGRAASAPVDPSATFFNPNACPLFREADELCAEIKLAPAFSSILAPALAVSGRAANTDTAANARSASVPVKRSAATRLVRKRKAPDSSAPAGPSSQPMSKHSGVIVIDDDSSDDGAPSASGYKQATQKKKRSSD